MARPGPKSKKSKPAPKSKKVVEKEPEVNSEEERDEQDDVEEEENPETKNGNSGAVDSEEEEEEEPPAKKGRGRPGAKGKAAAKKTPAKKGRSTSRGRKTPAAKKEESEDEEKEYEVQSIVNDRMKKGAKEYLVRWKGYKTSEATWEPESNLNCDDIIAAYEAKMKDAKNSQPKELREGRKQTERYAEISGRGETHRMRHSKRNTKSPRKSYRENPDSD